MHTKVHLNEGISFPHDAGYHIIIGCRKTLRTMGNTEGDPDKNLTVAES